MRPLSPPTNRPHCWRDQAIAKIEADYQRSADTHLIPLNLPCYTEAGIDLYLKDESTHPTGSLKHRLARSLFLYALCNGWVNEGTTIVEASSGSTAVSEAYFARLLGLPFVAVMPHSTSPEKIAQIEFLGGRCHFVNSAGEVYDAARELAASCNGHYMDQFTYAERATDWRGNNNIAQSMFQQMGMERHPIPRWIVVGAGTGGTSATIGRFLRYMRYDSQVCVADPEGSVFYDYWKSGDVNLSAPGSRIEGIGRPRVEPSFVRGVVDHMEIISNRESVAAMQLLNNVLGRKVGPSTGTNMVAMLRLADAMRQRGETGSLLTLLCDAGERYLPTYYQAEWVVEQFGDCCDTRNSLQSLMR